jgi:LysR family positive regulator for ilvC
MDIRTLELFRHLATSLHFAKTSRECHISPSALTRVIQRLETELGEDLFTRGNRSVLLTGKGQVFKKYADDVLLRWKSLQAELADDTNLKGELSMYCSVTAAYSILPAILSRYRRNHPDVQIKLETGDAARALSKLQNRDADVTIAALPEKLPRHLEFFKMTTSPLVFIAPIKFEDMVTYEGNDINWEATPLIIPDQGLSRERIDQWFASHHIRPNIYSQVAGNEAIIAMVSLGCGVGLVPELVLKKSVLADQVTVLEGAPDLVPFLIGICTARRNLSIPQVRALWTIARETAADAPGNEI